MESPFVRQLLPSDRDLIPGIAGWMYDWWAEKAGYTRGETACYMEHCLQRDRLPQTYGLFAEGRIAGLYQFCYTDLEVRPDIYPWLANVYIDREFRGKGYSRLMLETVPGNAGNSTPFRTLYLYTDLEGFYDRFGWKFVSLVDTFRKQPRMQRLYQMDLTGSANV